MCNFKVLFVVLFVLGVTVILAQDVSFRIDPSTDFSKYKTYKWVHTDHSVYPVDIQVTESLDSELGMKGLRRTDSEVADAFFCYHSNFGTEKILRYYSEMDGPNGPYTFTVHTGEVSIDMYDSSTKKLIWRNTVDINPKATPQHIRKAVSKLLKNYPVKKI